MYALVALGFVLIYKATETVNFAQGDLMMLGAFFGLTASTILGWPYWATILFAIVVMAVVGMLIERIVIRPVLGYPTFTVVMITIGVGYVLRGVVTMVPGWGTETYSLKTPFGEGVLRFGGAVIAAEQLATIGLTAALCPCSISSSASPGSASPCRRPRRTSSPPTTWASRCSA